MYRKGKPIELESRLVGAKHRGEGRKASDVMDKEFLVGVM